MVFIKLQGTGVQKYCTHISEQVFQDQQLDRLRKRERKRDASLRYNHLAPIILTLATEARR